MTHDLPADLVALPVAATVAYQRVFSTRRQRTTSNDELDLVALESRHRPGVMSQLSVKKTDLERVLRELKTERNETWHAS